MANCLFITSKTPVLFGAHTKLRVSPPFSSIGSVNGPPSSGVRLRANADLRCAPHQRSKQLFEIERCVTGQKGQAVVKQMRDYHHLAPVPRLPFALFAGWLVHARRMLLVSLPHRLCPFQLSSIVFVIVANCAILFLDERFVYAIILPRSQLLRIALGLSAFWLPSAPRRPCDSMNSMLFAPACAPTAHKDELNSHFTVMVHSVGVVVAAAFY